MFILPRLDTYYVMHNTYNMDFSFLKKPSAIYFLFSLAILLAWHGFLFFSPDKQTLANYLFNAGYGFILLSGSVVGIMGVRKFSLSSTIGKAVFFLSAGLFSYTIGQVLWLYYNLIAHTTVPYPSWADGFFVVFILLLVISVSFIARMFLTSMSKRLVVGSVIFFIIAASGMFLFIANPNLSSDQSWLTIFFNLAYPLADTILLALAVLIMRITGGRIHTSVIFLISGLLLQVGADLLFAYRIANHTYWNGDISDLLFGLSSVFFCLTIASLLHDFTSEPDTTGDVIPS